MLTEPYVIRYNESGHKIIASEACGGVVEVDMETGTDQYIPTDLWGYINVHKLENVFWQPVN